MVCSISFQVFSYDTSGDQDRPRPWGHKFEHGIKEGKIQNSSSLKLEGLELSYLVCSISLWTSTKFVHMMPLGSELALPLGQNWPQPRGHKLGHWNKERKFQNSSLKVEVVEL